MATGSDRQLGDEDVDGFYIDSIETLNRPSVSFLHIEVPGQWDDGPTTIRFCDIPRIRFEERYIEVYSKSLRTPSRDAGGGAFGLRRRRSP